MERVRKILEDIFEEGHKGIITIQEGDHYSSLIQKYEKWTWQGNK